MFAGITVYNTVPVLAQNSQGKYSILVQKLAQKFGLKADDVQTVFDDTFKEKQAQMEATFESELNQDVTNGKITENQKQLILAKRRELQTNRRANFNNFKNMTPVERKTAMQNQKQALSDWAKENNINLQYLNGGRRMGHLSGMKGGRDMMR